MRTRTASLHRSGWKSCSLITQEVQRCLKQRVYSDLSARHEILTVRDELARGAVCWSDEAWQAFCSPIHYPTHCGWIPGVWTPGVGSIWPGFSHVKSNQVAYSSHLNYFHNEWKKGDMSENKPTNQPCNALGYLLTEPVGCKRTPDDSLSLTI